MARVSVDYSGPTFHIHMEGPIELCHGKSAYWVCDEAQNAFVYLLSADELAQFAGSSTAVLEATPEREGSEVAVDDRNNDILDHCPGCGQGPDDPDVFGGFCSLECMTANGERTGL